MSNIEIIIPECEFGAVRKPALFNISKSGLYHG
jgi:hypothetical protein